MRLRQSKPGLPHRPRIIIKAEYAFSFVVPYGIEQAVTAAIPELKSLQESLPPPDTVASAVMHRSDAASLSRLKRSAQKVRDEISTLRRSYEKEEQKWKIGARYFTCAMKAARIAHRPLAEGPTGWSAACAPPDSKARAG